MNTEGEKISERFFFCVRPVRFVYVYLCFLFFVSTEKKLHVSRVPPPFPKYCFASKRHVLEKAQLCVIYLVPGTPVRI